MSEDKMPFLEHLSELRKRLMVSVTAVGAGFLICFAFSESIFKLLLFPMNSSVSFATSYPFVNFIPSGNQSKLIFLAPAEAFWAHMKIAMISGLILTSPILFREVWKFVSPALFKHEKRLALPFIFSATMLFMLGAAFCFVIILPFAMKFLLTYKTGSLMPMISVGKYMDFCLKFILSFGLVFELPVALVVLTRMGLVTPEKLSKSRKYAVVLAFIAAALLTPTPDAFNQILMALPIIVLYEAGIIASRIFKRRRDASDKG